MGRHVCGRMASLDELCNQSQQLFQSWEKLCSTSQLPSEELGREMVGSKALSASPTTQEEGDLKAIPSVTEQAMFWSRSGGSSHCCSLSEGVLR